MQITEVLQILLRKKKRSLNSTKFNHISTDQIHVIKGQTNSYETNTYLLRHSIILKTTDNFKMFQFSFSNSLYITSP